MSTIPPPPSLVEEDATQVEEPLTLASVTPTSTSDEDSLTTHVYPCDDDGCKRCTRKRFYKHVRQFQLRKLNTVTRTVFVNLFTEQSESGISQAEKVDEERKKKKKKSAWRQTRKVFRRICYSGAFGVLLCCMLCCPPFPSSITNKFAFPAPKPGYFMIDAERSKCRRGKKMVAVRRLKRSHVNRRLLLVVQREDSTRNMYIGNVEALAIETTRCNTIACVRVFSKTPARFTIIYSHPNASDISDHINDVYMPSLISVATYLSCNMVIYDYSGYGISGGKSTERNVYADIEAVYSTLTNRLGIRSKDIIFWGYSMGTAASIDLASKLKSAEGHYAALLLVAPFKSALSLVSGKLAELRRRKLEATEDSDEDDVSSTASATTSTSNTTIIDSRQEWPRLDRLRSYLKMKEVDAPTLLVHGANDNLVPPSHSADLAARCATSLPPVYIAGAGHDDLELSTDFWRVIKKFINDLAVKNGKPG